MRFAKRAARRRACVCCDSMTTIPSPPPPCCRKKTKKRRNESAARKIVLGHDDSCPFCVSACVTLLAHENYTPNLCLFSSLSSTRFFVCRWISRQTGRKSQVSRFCRDVHDQNGEQRNLQLRV